MPMMLETSKVVKSKSCSVSPSRCVLLIALSTVFSSCTFLVPTAGETAQVPYGAEFTPEPIKLTQGGEAKKQEVLKISASPKRELPALSLVVNNDIQREIRAFQVNGRRSMEDAMTQRSLYGDMLEEIFRDEGVPPELVSVALVESGYRPQARSGAGAVGMWQFMRGTAQLYGLKVGAREDQRKDVILATMAAARHLKDLFEIYGDWYLVLAAYNAGPGTVDRAIERAGTRDFWKLIRRGDFAQETRNFVPRVLAAAIIAQQPVMYGFVDQPLNVG